MSGLIAFWCIFFHLTVLAYATAADNRNTTTIGSESELNPSNTSSRSPTVTFISYVTVSTGNGTITAISNAPAVTDLRGPGHQVLITHTDCPWDTRSCYDPNNRSQTLWQPIWASVYNPYGFDTNDGSLAQTQCSDFWQSSIYSYLETAPWSSVFITLPPFTSYKYVASWETAQPIDIYPTGCCNPAEYGYFSSSAFPFTATPPCCGDCAFSVGDAEVYQWPVTGEPPADPTLYKAGNTFIYPSVYVAFQTIAATDTCGDVGTGLAGSTMAFAQSDISTANSYFWDSMKYSPLYGQLFPTYSPNYTQFNPTNSITCLDITTTMYMIDIVPSFGTECIPYTEPDVFFTTTLGEVFSCTPFPATYNPCSPILSVPPQVYTLNPKWSTCSGGIRAVHDPYAVLTSSNGFWPLTPRPTTHDSKTVVASAGASVTQNIAIQTATSVTYPTLRPTDGPQISKVLPSITIGTETFIANSNSAYIIDGQTIRPGGQITVSQNTISLASDGDIVQVDGTTRHIDQAYAIGTQTIYEGGPVMIVSGTTYSVASGGSSLVIDGTTEAASSETGVSTSGNGAQRVWLQVPAYIIGGQTLMAGGGPMTLSGTILSLEPGGESIVIVESRTEDINVFLGSLGPAETSTSGSSNPSSSAEQGDGYSSVIITTRGPASGVTEVKSGADRRMWLSPELRWLAFVLLIICGYQKL